MVPPLLTLRDLIVSIKPGTRHGVGFTVVDLSDTSFAGHAPLFRASLPARCADLVIMIGPQHVGRGPGTDPVYVLARYGSGGMGLHRVQLKVWAFNQRARRAYAKADFVEEGTRRDAVLRGGAWRDEMLLARLETDDSSVPRTGEDRHVYRAQRHLKRVAIGSAAWRFREHTVSHNPANTTSRTEVHEHAGDSLHLMA